MASNELEQVPLRRAIDLVENRISQEKLFSSRDAWREGVESGTTPSSYQLARPMELIHNSISK